MASCNWKEYSCKVAPTESGFCKKHHQRGILLQLAAEKGVRICDGGKRACRNVTIAGKSKCEVCLQKNREREKQQYAERKEKGGVCVMCGIEITEDEKGFFGHSIQKCPTCYMQMRAAEDKRGKVERNFGHEKRLNPLKHFREYIDCASSRNIPFELTLEQFSELVQLPCYYCKFSTDHEVIGIDRINSDLGYSIENVKPCCKICNVMKGTLTLDEFAKHITIIYKHFAESHIYITEKEEVSELPPSYRMSQKDIRSLYGKRKLHTYITLCEADSRSPLLIEKLKSTLTYTMTQETFGHFLDNALRADGRMQSKTKSDRSRIPTKLMKSYLQSNQPLEVVKLYESIFGVTKGIREDMIQLAKQWKENTDAENEFALQQCKTKYNNQRAKARREGEELTEKDEEITLSTSSPQVNISTISSSNAAYTPPPVSSSNAAYIPPPVETFAPIITSPSPLTQTTPAPAQWKVSSIYAYCMTGKEDIYLSYLKESNPDVDDMNERFTTLLTQIKTSDRPKAEENIQQFVLDLRRLRHNALCYKKNHKVLDRDDREVWRADTVLHAFQTNRLDEFKKFTEENVGDKPDDPVWMKRWESFVEGVKETADIEKKKGLISKFFIAQRTKKYRRGS